MQHVASHGPGEYQGRVGDVVHDELRQVFALRNPACEVAGDWGGRVSDPCRLEFKDRPRAVQPEDVVESLQAPRRQVRMSLTWMLVAS